MIISHIIADLIFSILKRKLETRMEKVTIRSVITYQLSFRARFDLRCHDGTRLTDLRPLSSNTGRPSRAKGRRCIRHASTGQQPAQ